jgi:CMP/dCMP kinase
MTIPNIIAIDGPAASGKSTVGRRLADELGYLFFDTGVMYRAITWGAIQQGISNDDEKGLTELANTAEIDVHPPSIEDGRICDVIFNGQDITWETRSPEVEANVSPVSTYKDVRKALAEKQRAIGLRGRVVMVGRDIGTVVLPEADLKIFLDASAEERARRRYKEITDRGGTIEYQSVLEGVLMRDRIDSSRACSPLTPASDAVIINTDSMNIDQVLDNVKLLCQIG